MRKPIQFATHRASYAYARQGEYFRVHVTYVVDGDTFDCLVDLGMGQYAYETIRVLDFNAPELFSAANTAERVHAREALERAKALILDSGCLIKTFKDRETFGRYVAEVWYPVAEGSALGWKNLAETLIFEGFEQREFYA